MTTRQFAILLVEKMANDKIDKKISVFINRLVLRLYSQPALMANLADVTAFKPGTKGDTHDQVEDGKFHEDQQEPEQDESPEEGDDGTVLVQLSFRRLPNEVISPLLRLIAAPREPKLFRFTKDGSARTGIEIDLKPDDFPGDEYEYAF